MIPPVRVSTSVKAAKAEARDTCCSRIRRSSVGKPGDRDQNAGDPMALDDRREHLVARAELEDGSPERAVGQLPGTSHVPTLTRLSGTDSALPPRAGSAIVAVVTGERRILLRAQTGLLALALLLPR